MANNQLLASDNFASGSLAAGWAVIPTNSFSQVTGSPFVAEPPSTAATGSRQRWTGLAFSNDQTSEITINAITSQAGTQAELWVRVQSGSYSGYLATISNGQVGLFRMDSGVATALGSAQTVTLAAGDIFSMTIAGAAIVVYQNYKQVHRYMDATYVSGAPGFGCQSTVAVANVKIGSWRGYNAIQQDGIWQKQGTLAGLAPLAGDFSLGSGGVSNSSPLYDINPQLISPDASGKVYKMWFSAGAPGAESNCYYAESTDLINWTRSGTVVVANFGSPFIIKNGSTYYLYAQPAAQMGSGNFALYTSTTGAPNSFSQVSANVFGKGTAGQWDDNIIWYLQPVAIINGTWYFLYSGGHDLATTRLSLGLATSPDGITLTREPTNPVLTGGGGSSTVNSCALAQVGSTFYMWMFGNVIGQGSANPSLNPGEGVRYSTTDFKTWVGPVHSVHRTEIYEGVNFIGGQSYPNSIFTVGNQTYMIIQSAVNDGGLRSEYQLSLAIAPATIAQIVTQNEDAVGPLTTDTFNRAAGGLGANWTTPTGGSPAQIISNGVVEATVLATPAFAVYTGATFSNDQISNITVNSMGTNNNLNAMVRMSTSSLTGYLLNIIGPTNSAAVGKIYKLVNGTFTQLGDAAGVQVTPQVGDVFSLQVVGNVLSLLQNGFMILQVQDVNNTITSGNPGFRISPDTVNLANCQISAWSAGNANVIPSYPPIATTTYAGDAPMIASLLPVLKARIRIAMAAKDRK
jgi:hypothetical protein